MASKLKGLYFLIAAAIGSGVLFVAKNFESWLDAVKHGADDVPGVVDELGASAVVALPRIITWDEFEQGLDWAAQEYLTGNAVQDANDLYEHVQQAVQDWEREPERLKGMCERLPVENVVALNIPGVSGELLRFADWQNYVDSLYARLNPPTWSANMFSKDGAPESVLLGIRGDLYRYYNYHMGVNRKPHPVYGKLYGASYAEPYTKRIGYLEGHPRFAILVEHMEARTRRKYTPGIGIGP